MSRVITIQFQEKEFKEVEQKLKETLNDKDTLMSEKAGVINQLTQNLENALHRCQEFSGIIEKISEENKTLKLSTTSMCRQLITKS